MIKFATVLMAIAPLFAPQPAAVTSNGAIASEPPIDRYESKARFDGSGYEMQTEFREDVEQDNRNEDDIKPTPRMRRDGKDGQTGGEGKFFDYERTPLPRPRKEFVRQNGFSRESNEVLGAMNGGAKITFRFGEFSMVFPEPKPRQNEEIK